MYVVNTPPQAANDIYAVNQSQPLTIASALGVLSNDSVAEDVLTSHLVTGPAHGTLSLVTNGSFIYTPNAGFTGSDSFTYRAWDGAAERTAMVTLNVSDARPTANDDFYTGTAGLPLTIAAGEGVLANDAAAL